MCRNDKPTDNTCHHSREFLTMHGIFPKHEGHWAVVDGLTGETVRLWCRGLPLTQAAMTKPSKKLLLLPKALAFACGSDGKQFNRNAFYVISLVKRVCKYNCT